MLNAPDLQGYRALWFYLAGSAAWLGANNGNSGLDVKARSYFSKAKKSASGIPWLIMLSRLQLEEEATKEEAGNLILMEQIERLELILAKLGTVHHRNFTRREKDILDGLGVKEKFEQSHKLLGELLGFNAGKVESDGSPDPWWIAGTICLVFEDHAGAGVGGTLNVNKARQASSHPEWIKENIPLNPETEIFPVILTPVLKVKQGAVPHIKSLYLWELKSFQEWAINAVSVIRELRVTFTEPGNLDWRQEASDKFKLNKMDSYGIVSLLKANPAIEKLKPVK